MMNKKSKNKKLRRKLSFVLFVAAVGVLMSNAGNVREDSKNR